MQSTADILDPIKPLDLTLVRTQLLHNGMSEREFAEAESEYRKFLALSRAYPDDILRPSKIVDMLWHTHILYTRKYTDDCSTLVGRYLHHQPDVADPAATKERAALRDRTLQLYENHFGKPPEMWLADRTCTAPGCQNNG